MKTAAILRRTALNLLPATLLLAACSKTDVPTPTPAVDHGRVLFVNAASHIAPTTLKFSVDNTEKASVAYGASSSYQDINSGSARSLQVAAGTQTALTQSLPVDKDKNYTFVATPASTTSSVGGLLVTDDLTVPASGKARIRVINTTLSVAAPVRLSQVTSTAGGPVVFDIVTNVAINTASAFTDFNPGVYTLSILDNAGATLAVVGDGSGAGTGVRKFEEGKLYTVVVSGTAGSLNPDQKIKAFLSLNN